VQFYDDYAHHPTEIEATLAALREWYPKSRVYALFQSHTFSRTKALLNEFAHAFKQADEVLLIEIFPSAREAYDATINSDLLAEKITQAGKPAKNLHDIEGVRAYLKQKLQPGDVVITLGAGDLYHLHEVM
jgi:UDP-N-acetylmuramate--alanine ligase